MALEDVVERVQARLRALGISAQAASKAAGLSPDAIRNMERAVKAGKRQGVSTRTVTALAPVLHTTSGWLLDGIGDEDGEGTTDSVPVVGYVGAGALAVMFSEGQGPFDMVPAPDGSTKHTVAAEIRGESLGPLFDQWLVFYDDVRSPVTPDLIGQLCVVGLADGRVLVKRLQRSAGTDLYHLISNAEGPMLDQAVEWAAKVKTMSPRY